MRQVTIYTTDKEYSHFVRLAKNLHYVKRIETDDDKSKEDILHNLKAGLEEVQLFKKGKLKTSPAKTFLDDL
ncbi:MAG: hypothetical protein ACOYN4_10740 [Bacteroidales bacterium]